METAPSHSIVKQPWARSGLRDPCSQLLTIEQIQLQQHSCAAPDIPSLTARMARGDEEAYREFYELYFGRLLRYLLVLTRDQETARDALQMTFLRVVRHAKPFESEAAFWSWLTVLARSSASDEGRRARRYLGFLDRLFAQKSVQAAGGSENPDTVLLELLESGMRELPDGERDLLERKYFQGESVRQIAQQEHVTEKAIESRLSRIRQKVRDRIFSRAKHEH